MREYLEYGLVKSILFLTNLLPISFVYTLCKKLALFLFEIDKRRRTLSLRNLQLAYPDLNEDERLNLAKKVYENVALSVAEIILMMQKRLDIDSMIEDYEQALIDMRNCFEHQRTGTLLLTAHFGNWELLAHFFAKHGYPVVVIGRKGNNALIETKLTAPFRTMYGNTLAYKEQAMSAIIRALKHNGIAGMLIDQKASGANSIKATFFAHQVDTVNSTAMLKLRYDPAVVSLFMARQKSGKYKLIVGSSADVILDEKLSETEKIEHLTQRYNDIIEEIVRAYPEQWFWMHDRWRIAK
ncbi:MAG: lysophospholipid acyltransferase family protein [Sulfurospirillaceae bacterium]|nr:lysophospholipid acyltransferase family protein [Sulfurospirillaceae bacterium]